MGCCASKETSSDEANVQLNAVPPQLHQTVATHPRPQTGPPQNRPRTAKSRPGTSSHKRPSSSSQGARPGSRQSSSQRPESRSNRPESRSNRPESRSNRPESRSNRPQSRGHRPESGGHRPESRRRRDHEKRQSRATYPIPEEQPPEDKLIHHEIRTLSTLADQHAEHYYISHNEAGSTPIRTYVRQQINKTIINNIIKGNMNGMAEAVELSDSLKPYAMDQTSQSRGEHLRTLFETGARIKQMTDRHPSEWTFGSWDSQQGAVVQFPSVLKDGYEVMRAEYE